MNELNNRVAKCTVVFVVLQYISAIIFYLIIFLNSGFSDGATGMAPLSMFLGILTSAIICVIVGVVFGKKIGGKLTLILNYLFFEIAHLFFSGDMPLFKVFKKGLSGDLARIESVAFVAATLFVLYIYLMIKKTVDNSTEGNKI